MNTSLSPHHIAWNGSRGASRTSNSIYSWPQSIVHNGSGWKAAQMKNYFYGKDARNRYDGRQPNILSAHETAAHPGSRGTARCLWRTDWTKRIDLQRIAWCCMRSVTTTPSIFISCTDFGRTISEGSREADSRAAGRLCRFSPRWQREQNNRTGKTSTPGHANIHSALGKAMTRVMKSTLGVE